jgi:hypothetical protein
MRPRPPPPPTTTTPRGALHVAAVNVADVAAYCIQGRTPAGMWSCVARHTPAIVDMKRKTMYCAASRGHRLRPSSDRSAGQDGAGAARALEVQPHPSFIFVRAAIDLYCLEATEKQLAADKAPTIQPAQGARDPIFADPPLNYATDLILDKDPRVPSLVPRRRTRSD